MSRGPDWLRIYAQPAPWRDVVDVGENGEPVYGPEYLPRSCRTGRAVSFEAAQRDYLDAFGAVGSPGLWDHEEDPGPPPVRREDHEVVVAAVARWPNQFGPRQHDVVEWYWRRQASELVCAVELALSLARVHQLVLEVRRKVGILMRHDAGT